MSDSLTRSGTEILYFYYFTTLLSNTFSPDFVLCYYCMSQSSEDLGVPKYEKQIFKPYIRYLLLLGFFQKLDSHCSRDSEQPLQRTFPTLYQPITGRNHSPKISQQHIC